MNEEWTCPMCRAWIEMSEADADGLVKCRECLERVAPEPYAVQPEAAAPDPLMQLAGLIEDHTIVRASELQRKRGAA